MPTKGARTKQQIVAAAAPIFNQRGFAGASIATILEATGLEKGGLYRHFASKDELAIAAFDHAMNVLEARRTAAESAAADPLARLHAYVDVVARSIEDPPLPGGCPILNTAIDADDTHAELRARARSAMNDWQHAIADCIDDGVRHGRLRSDADAAAVASVITAALEGAIMISSLLRDPAQMQRVAAHLHRFIEGLT